MRQNEQTLTHPSRGRVFGATATLDGVPAGYRDMAGRTILKVLIRP